MASYFPRSSLKSQNSHARSWRTVSYSFEEQLLKNSSETSTTSTRPSPHNPSSYRRSPLLLKGFYFTSRVKRDYSRDLHASFTSEHGLSLEEITCDEIDDILPKTDYTYAKTASYSQSSSLENYHSPNMSRRRLRRSQPEFLSDDEEEFRIYENFSSNTRVYSKQREDEEFERESSTKGSQIYEADLQKLRNVRGEDVMTSTPMDSHARRRISGNDYYYEGILLRSGSRVKGAAGYNKSQMSSRSESKVVQSGQEGAKSDVALNSSHRYDVDVTSWKNNARNFFTTTETTTTTTTNEQNQKKSPITEDLSERKLLLDESQTEKGWNRKEYKLKHLYGLDYEEEISDLDDVKDADLSAKTMKYNHHSHRGSSFFSYFITIITTVVTTVTSTFTDVITLVNQPLAQAADVLIRVPGRWLLRSLRGSELLRGLGGSASWLITRSATFLLWDINVKQRKRRGCCCCFLPLLFLLPLLLLAGYYTRDMQRNLGAHLSDNKQLLSSPWSYLWFTSSSKQEVSFTKHSPQVALPVTIQTSDQIQAKEAVQQVDMTLIYQYIQQAVAESAAANKDDRPVGLTIEQVQAIVMDLMASNINEVTSGLEGQVIALKSLLQGNVASIQHKISELEAEIKENTRTQQTLTDNLNQARTSFEGSSSAGQNVEWLAAAMALEHKLLNLTHKVNNLSSESAALTAMLTNCCRNNSDIVRTYVISILSQMRSDEDSKLAGLMAQMSGQYVDKGELDQRLSAISEEIMKNLNVIFAKMEGNSNAGSETQTSIIAGINELAVKSIIEEALIQFGADRIGMPDFALESSGGSVISVRCSETFYKKTALVSIFGIPLWYTSNSPRTVIQPNVNPGECWAFKGHTGFIVFQLSHPIMPTGFTLEHIPRSLAPMGDISSAPKDFAVFGLISESDIHGINLGNYTYFDNGKPIQFFSVQNGHPGIFQIIELRILDNHGNKEYTCVYRFRVHGQP